MKRELYDEQALQSQLSDPTQRRKAFEIVVRKLSSQIYWQIRRLVFSHDDADDILQNTFMKPGAALKHFVAIRKYPHGFSELRRMRA